MNLLTNVEETADEHSIGFRSSRAYREVALTVASNRRTIVLFTIASVFFGGTFVAAKAGQAYVPPLLLVAIRFDLAAVLMIGYAYVTIPTDELLPRTRGDIAGILAAGIFAIGLSNGLLFLGQGHVPSAVGAILFSLVPIFSPAIAMVLLSDERLSGIGAVGTVVGLFGVALVVGVDPGRLLQSLDIGALLLLSGAVSLALGTVLIRRSKPSISSTARIAWALPVSAVLLHGLSVFSGESLAAAEWTLVSITALVYLGVFAGAVAYVAYFDLLDEVGAIHSSLTFYASPIVATIGGWLLLGEAITTLTVVGFVVIVAGFAIIGHESLLTAVGSLSGRRSHTVRSQAVRTDGGVNPDDD